MTRTVTILILALAVVAFLWGNAFAAGKTLQDITLEEIYSPKLPKLWREGFYTGMFLATPVDCPMSTNMVIAGIEASLQAGEITRDWTAYQAMLYVLARHGCTMEKPRV